MVAVPATRPETTPNGSTVAIARAPDVHVPAALSLVNAVLEPAHTESVPDIASGIGLTVIVAEVMQPVPRVYMIVATPWVIPVTAPAVPVPTPTVTSVLLHEPPEVASVRMIVDATQTAEGPPMLPGFALTVTSLIALQPVLSE